MPVIPSRQHQFAHPSHDRRDPIPYPSSSHGEAHMLVALLLLTLGPSPPSFSLSSLEFSPSLTLSFISSHAAFFSTPPMQPLPMLAPPSVAFSSSALLSS